MENKPKLLLHTCCGVCGSWLAEMLSKKYEVIMYYFNPNIFPESEYGLRRDASRGVAEKLGMKFIEGLYDHSAWQEAVKGLEGEPEGGKRCEKCFDWRL
ncbi:MAG: diacylglucosamine hydrolase, partial [Calditrichae bacterium]|nr:diacylglucosamine hydrolase [Calditrichia bacterium]